MIIPCMKYFKELKSTNSYALEHFDELDMGDVVIADVQTNGRGRFERVWEGKFPDNIYMSFVIKFDNPEEFPIINLTQYLSVIINKIFNEKYGIASNIKWPNDILFEDKKIAGILAEAKISANKISGIVLGVGINVNYAPTETVPNSISMKDILNRKIKKNELAKLISEEFFANYRKFEKEGFSFIEKDYIKMCKFSNEVKIGNSYKEGEFSSYKFSKINSDGTISVMTDENKEIKIVSGDILC